MHSAPQEITHSYCLNGQFQVGGGHDGWRGKFLQRQQTNRGSFCLHNNGLGNAQLVDIVRTGVRGGCGRPLFITKCSEDFDCERCPSSPCRNSDFTVSIQEHGRCTELIVRMLVWGVARPPVRVGEEGDRLLWRRRAGGGGNAPHLPRADHDR